MAVININNDNFENEVIKCANPVLIDFWAPWCGPCKMISPIVEEIASENEDFSVCKINVDEEPDLASRYGVMSIPTMIVVKNGEEVARSVGARPKAAILEMLGK